MSTFAVDEPEATFLVSAAMRVALAGFTKLYAEFAEPCVQKTLEEHCCSSPDSELTSNSRFPQTRH